jgi:hypothetical protein
MEGLKNEKYSLAIPVRGHRLRREHRHFMDGSDEKAVMDDWGYRRRHGRRELVRVLIGHQWPNAERPGGVLVPFPWGRGRRGPRVPDDEAGTMRFKRPESNNPLGIARAMMKEASAPVTFESIGVNAEVAETPEFKTLLTRLESREGQKPIAVKLSKTLPKDKAVLYSDRYDGFINFEDPSKLVFFEKERETNVYGQMQTVDLPSVQ